MRNLLQLALVAAAGFFGNALARPVTTVHPGDVHDIIITSNNTVNATHWSPTNGAGNATTSANLTASSNTTSTPKTKLVEEIATSSTSGRLPLSLVNNFPGGSINAYVTGLDSNNELVMLMPDGTFFYPTALTTTAVPQPVSNQWTKTFVDLC